MANVNKVILMGNLTRDPELRYTPKGTAVAELGIAINRSFGGGDGGERQEETTFVDVTLWGRQAEIADQYLSKGRGVYIEGRLQLDTWEDKASGQKRSKLKVVGENLQFLPSAGQAASSQRARETKSEREAREGAAAGKGKPISKEEYDQMDEDEEEIPF